MQIHFKAFVWVSSYAGQKGFQNRIRHRGISYAQQLVELFRRGVSRRIYFYNDQAARRNARAREAIFREQRLHSTRILQGSWGIHIPTFVRDIETASRRVGISIRNIPRFSPGISV